MKTFMTNVICWGQPKATWRVSHCGKRETSWTKQGLACKVYQTNISVMRYIITFFQIVNFGTALNLTYTKLGYPHGTLYLDISSLFYFTPIIVFNRSPYIDMIDYILSNYFLYICKNAIESLEYPVYYMALDQPLTVDHRVLILLICPPHIIPRCPIYSGVMQF